MWYAHFEGEFIKRQMEVGGGGGKCFVAGKGEFFLKVFFLIFLKFPQAATTCKCAS